MQLIKQRLSQHLTLDYMIAEHIIIYHLTDIDRETVDLWVRNAINELAICEANGYPVLMMHELGHHIFSPTPYANKRGSDARIQHPSVHGRIAYVTTNKNRLANFRLIIRQNATPYREREVFTESKRALQWLRAFTPSDA